MHKNDVFTENSDFGSRAFHKIKRVGQNLKTPFFSRRKRVFLRYNEQRFSLRVRFLRARPEPVVSGQQEAGHEGVVTRCDDFSLRSSVAIPAGSFALHRKHSGRCSRPCTSIHFESIKFLLWMYANFLGISTYVPAFFTATYGS